MCVASVSIRKRTVSLFLFLISAFARAEGEKKSIF